MTKKAILYLSVLLFTVSCNQPEEIITSQKIDIDQEGQYIIGTPNSTGGENLYYTSGIQVDNNGDIFVANNRNMIVDKYTSEGEFIKSLGGRGRGPGEFISIKGIKLIRDTLYVFDQKLQKLNLYSRKGEYIKSLPIKNIRSPIYMDLLNDEQIVMIYPTFEPTENKFAHIYNRSLSNKGQDFMPISDFNQSFEAYSQISHINKLLSAWQGSTLVDNNTLWYVPYFYNSEIYQYAKGENGKWNLNNVIEGQVDRKPISFINESHFRHPDITHSSVHLNENLRILAHNTTRGLFKVKDYYYHFIFTDIENERIFGVEVYDKNMQPLGYSPIDSVAISGEKFNFLAWNVDDVDDEGYVYIRERYPKGVKIRKMKISIDNKRSKLG